MCKKIDKTTALYGQCLVFVCSPRNNTRFIIIQPLLREVRCNVRDVTITSL